MPALGPPAPVIEDPGLGNRQPAVDIVETPGRIYVTLEIPGASQGAIEIETDESRLMIRAPGPDGREFRSVVELPDCVDPSAVEVAYRHGVLDLTLPRRRWARGPSVGDDLHGE